MNRAILDRFQVDLIISPECSDEKQREILQRLDNSRFFRDIRQTIQGKLGKALMDDIQVEIKR